MPRRSAEPLEPVLAARERLVALITRTVGSRERAEEIFQGALARALERPAAVPRATEEVTYWFLRVLRNAAADELRHRSAGLRALQALAREASPEAFEDPLRREVCACLGELLPTLKPDQAQLIRAVDLEGRSVSDVAKEVGITANSASVKLHRGRKALKQALQNSCRACAAHHCLDCTCRTAPAARRTKAKSR